MSLHTGRQLRCKFGLEKAKKVLSVQLPEKYIIHSVQRWAEGIAQPDTTFGDG